MVLVVACWGAGFVKRGGDANLRCTKTKTWFVARDTIHSISSIDENTQLP